MRPLPRDGGRQAAHRPTATSRSASIRTCSSSTVGSRRAPTPRSASSPRCCTTVWSASSGSPAAAEAEDWHALLLIISRTPEELIQDGGIAKAWAESGRSHLEIREIDYAEVLRERGGGAEAAWDHIIACCLHGESPALDEQALTALVAAIGDSERFGELLARLQASPAAGGAGMAATAAAMVQLVRTAVETAIARGCDRDRTLDTAATSMARLTPEMLLGVLAAGQSDGPDSAVAASVIGRMTDDTIASFVANSVAVDRGATERLAHAFEALVPELQRKEQLLELAQDKARGHGTRQGCQLRQPVADGSRHADVVLGQEIRLRRLRPGAIRGENARGRSRTGRR